MQVYTLELQGTGDDEYAFECAGVFSDRALAQARLAEVNAEYTTSGFFDEEDVVFALEDNARIEEYKLDA